MENLTDKESAIEINERLHFYVRRVRQLRNESDLDAFYKSISALEDEVKDTKKAYEAEIAKLRYAIEILNREKSDLEKDIIERKNMEAHLNDRLNVEVDKAVRFRKEIDEFKNEIVHKDYNIRELQMTLNQAYYESSGVKKELEDKIKLSEELQRKLDMSSSEFKDTTNRLKIVEEKLSFQESFTEERISELKRRIETYLMTIAELENKVEQLEMREKLFPEQLKKVKEDADADMRKFQHDTDEYYKETILTLQEQLETERVENRKLQQETERLIEKVTDGRNVIADYKSQLTTLEQQKRLLNQNLESERHESLFSINTLERKVKELQQTLAVQAAEASQNRDMTDSLRSELDAMRALLHEEEARLGISRKPVAPVQVRSSEIRHETNRVVETSNIEARHESSHTEVTSTNIVENTDMQKLRVLLMHEQSENKEIDSKCIADIECPSTSRSQTDMEKVQLETKDKDLCIELGEDFGADQTSNSEKQPSEPLTPRDAGASTLKDEEHRQLSNRDKSEASHASTYDKGSKKRPTSSKRHSVGRQGEGRDYFEEMFQDIDEKLVSTPTGNQDQSLIKASALGDIKILEVNPEGRFVRILNSNEKQEAQFGDYSLKQNVGGHPIAVFRFPPQTKIAPNSTATVWTSCNDPKVHRPPTDFYWSQYERFNTGPECTTVVSDSQGKATAWTSPYHRYTKDVYQILTPTASLRTGSLKDELSDDEAFGEIPAAEAHASFEDQDSGHALKREKMSPYYVASKHPHGHYIGESVHPKGELCRTELWTNENISVNRQSRCQTFQTPDPVPGEPYCGAENQTVGSARVLKYYPATLRKSATHGNRVPDVILRSSQGKPSPFSKPHTRFNDGMRQVQSMYDPEHFPPMPKPQAT